jgi:hypothetical protein
MDANTPSRAITPGPTTAAKSLLISVILWPSEIATSHGKKHAKIHQRKAAYLSLVHGIV